LLHLSAEFPDQLQALVIGVLADLLSSMWLSSSMGTMPATDRLAKPRMARMEVTFMMVAGG
jgi:hypothetical protein